MGTQARIYLYLCSLQFRPLPGSLILQGRTTVLPVAIRYVCPGVTKVGCLSSLMISRSFEPGYACAPEIKARDQVTGHSKTCAEMIALPGGQRLGEKKKIKIKAKKEKRNEISPKDTSTLLSPIPSIVETFQHTFPRRRRRFSLFKRNCTRNSA